MLQYQQYLFLIPVQFEQMTYEVHLSNWLVRSLTCFSAFAAFKLFSDTKLITNWLLHNGIELTIVDWIFCSIEKLFFCIILICGTIWNDIILFFRIYRIDQHNCYIFEQFLAFLVLVPRLLIVKLLILILLMRVHQQQYIIEVLCKMLYFDHKLLIMLNNPFLKSFDVFLVFLLYYQYFFLLHHILFLFVLLY